jgi:hypothetical protein
MDENSGKQSFKGEVIDMVKDTEYILGLTIESGGNHITIDLTELELPSGLIRWRYEVVGLGREKKHGLVASSISYRKNEGEKWSRYGK